MLKIGEFSRLSQVTVATLRHYDAIGLLKPAHIDEFTGYRYYSVEQLAEIHRIMTLKELGLALDQIGELLSNGVTVEQLRGMLLLKEAEARQRVADSMAQLARIRFHLGQIEADAGVTGLDVRLKEIRPFRALTSRHQFATHAEIIPVALDITDAIRRHAIELAGPPNYFIYGDEYRPDNIDVEFVLPVSEEHQERLTLPVAGMLTARDIPGVRQSASYLYRGNPDDVNFASVDLQHWVVANGYRLDDVIRLVHLRGPIERLPMDEWLIEAQHPLDGNEEG